MVGTLERDWLGIGFERDRGLLLGLGQNTIVLLGVGLAPVAAEHDGIAVEMENLLGDQFVDDRAVPEPDADGILTNVGLAFGHYTTMHYMSVHCMHVRCITQHARNLHRAAIQGYHCSTWYVFSNVARKLSRIARGTMAMTAWRSEA